jgi:hypothetical protein
MSPDNNHEEIKRLLVENQRLLLENNQLLHKMRRSAVVGSVFRFVWFLIIVGAPVYLYFSYIQPNMSVIKQKFNNFEQMTSESEAVKKFFEAASSWNSNQKNEELK